MAADEASEDVTPSSPPLLSHDANDNVDNADHSLSNASSPLTEVEDKDGEPDEMDLDVDGPVHNSSSLSNVNLDDEDDNENGSRAARSRSASDNEDESALSEVEPDINDSEAETERLYDTPTKAKNIKDGAADVESSPESVTMGLSPTKRLAAQAQSRDRTFQASPSKLKQQLHADSDEEDAEEDDDEDDALSEAEDEENNEADGEEEAAADDREATRSSRRRSLAAKEQAKKMGQSPSVGSKTKDETNGDKEDTPVPTPALLRSQRSSNSNSDTRKRKRSPTTDPSESDQPLRKRIGSGARDAPSIAEDVDGEKVSSKRVNGATDDDAAAETGADEKAEADNSAEGTNSDTFRARRSKRGSAKKTRSNSDGDDNEDQNENDDAEDGDMATAEEDAAGQGDDEPIDGDIDEEAEAAHRNEEELERKKAALENLHAIEKQFASFRDKLYQERLDQLNQEEEMLLGDNPTHPEYLAMMQCVNERRDEKIRVIDVEYEFNLQTLKRWAVARRSHIHGQYFQSIRESRELVLEELGRQWYQIQQQRRRHANTIPDYGLQFPTAKTQRVKDAITYNKEVSILSGIAKYEGFPAAPKINGASSSQVDDDLEAIARGRQSVPSVHAVQPHSHSHPHLHTAHGQGHGQGHGHSHSPYPELAGSTLTNGNGNGNTAATAANGNGGPVSFHSLGAAGQQFLADTPWANPHHPAHSAHHVQLQQQQRQQGSPAAKSTASASASVQSGQPPTPQQPRKPLPPQAAASHGASKSGSNNSSGASHVPYPNNGQPAPPPPPKTALPPPMSFKRDVATIGF